MQAFHGQKELFKSEHTDWCFASTIESKCRVHSLQTYQVIAECSEDPANHPDIVLARPLCTMIRVAIHLCCCRRWRMLERMTSLQDSHIGCAHALHLLLLVPAYINSESSCLNDIFNVIL